MRLLCLQAKVCSCRPHVTHSLNQSINRLINEKIEEASKQSINQSCWRSPTRFHSKSRVWFCINAMPNSYCSYQEYGDAPIPRGQAVRKAVVILNNGAHKSKGRKLYDNYAAPLLHLAGIQTTLYVTNDITKLREYLEHTEPTNAVIFAGGDSTVFECVQSYLTLDRPDLVEIPVGILPLGLSNVVYNALRPDSSKEAMYSISKSKSLLCVLRYESFWFFKNFFARKIAKAAMTIVEGRSTPTDVLEIKVGIAEFFNLGFGDRLMGLFS